MQPEKKKVYVGRLFVNDVERENLLGDVLSTMTFDLCGITHATGMAHPGCPGCGECMAVGTYGLVPWGWAL